MLTRLQFCRSLTTFRTVGRTLSKRYFAADRDFSHENDAEDFARPPRALRPRSGLRDICPNILPLRPHSGQLERVEDHA